jgi:outer membrane protein
MQNRRLLLFVSIVNLVLLGLGAAGPARADSSPETVLTVDQAIELAVQYNLKYRLAEGEVQIAEEKVAQAKTGYRPKVTVSGGVSRLNQMPDIVELGRKLAELNNGVYQMLGELVQSTTNQLSPYYSAYQQMGFKEGPDDGLTYYSLKLQVEQPLYTGGKLTALNEQARNNRKYSQLNLDTVEQDLILEVKKAYYTVLQTQQMLTTMNEAVASMENHVREAELYYQAGIVPQLDVLRTEVKLADIKQKRLTVQNGLNLAKTYFNFVLGVDQEKQYRFQDEVAYTLFGQDLAGCQQTALANRTELKAIQAKVAMAENAVTIAKSAKKPLVALIASGDRTATEPFEDDPDLSLSLVAKYNLYDAGMVKHQVAEAEATVRQARTGEELAIRGIKLEVEQAYRNLQNALETIEVSKKVLSQAQETVRMAGISFQAGLSTSLELVDAETGLTQAKTNYNQALSNYQIALAQLERAIGTKRRKQS